MTPPDCSAHDAALPAQPTSPLTWAWTGELDFADAAALSIEWWSLLDDHPASVVIDLSAVTFLDCSILSVLVRANHDPVTRLLLQGTPAHIDEMMQLTGLGTAFDRAASADRRDPA